jgi:hypothetical protein
MGAMVAAATALALKPVAAMAATAGTAVVEHTYLKARAGRRDALITYIERNWFEMDRKGMQAGIFTFYQLLEEVTDKANSEWDLIVAVGYPTAAGFDDPKAKTVFKDIRAQHKEVAVDGLTMKDLGAVVKSHRVRLRSGSGSTGSQA